jgi:hypothetical protein
MNFSDLFKNINWRTTGCAIGYLVCNIVSSAYPSFADACSILDKIFVAGGFISAADSTRLGSIVQAVDHVSWKNGVDPATLLPIKPV